MAERSIAKRVAAGCVTTLLAGSIVHVGTSQALTTATPRRAHLPSALVERLATGNGSDDITVVVHLREQASLKNSRRGNREERQRAVVRELRDTAARAQAPVRRVLDTRRWQGRVREYTPLWASDAIVVTASPDVIAELASRPDVESITPDAIDVVPAGTPVAPPEPNIEQINATPLWAQGLDGTGVLVASLDSGVDTTSPDLSAGYRGGTNSWYDPYGQHPDTPFDASGHGTATMGVMVGGGAGGTTVGVAPGASWIAAKIFDDSGTATSSAIHLAMQWVLDPDGDPSTADAPAVVNNSWSFGTPGCNLEFQADLQALRAAGIVPVFAAGNYGSGGATSVSPANYPEAVSVGAVDSQDRIWSGSSRGPSACDGSSVYPDVVAPGVNVWTTDRFGLYGYWTGTSIAAPAVSGAIALLLSDTSASVSAPDAALLDTAVDIGATGPDNVFGTGRIDVAAALTAATTPTTTTTSSSTTTTSTTTTTLPPPTTTSTTSTTTTTSTTSTTSTTTTTTAMPSDTAGPLSSGLSLTPNPTNGSVDVALHATGSDVTTGGSNVVSRVLFDRCWCACGHDAGPGGGDDESGCDDSPVDG